MYALDDYDYDLPDELIAQHPAATRDHSRLLVLERNGGKVSHRRFDDLAGLLVPGDVLVINDTAVIPGRLIGRKATGGRVEVLILDYAEGIGRVQADGSVEFQCLASASRGLRPGAGILFEAGLQGTVVDSAQGVRTIRFSGPEPVEKLLARVGQVPLPPYIRRSAVEPGDRQAYQTVYARCKGAVAAPTAGLHFTADLMDRIRGRGISFETVTLHVGVGTFRPVRVEDIRCHRMHAERYHLSTETAARIRAAKREGRRVIAVGTTSVRTLETATGDDGRLRSGSGSCQLFIYPGYTFKMVDGLITNFHLPRSTLLMLVSALAGRSRILAAYRQAVAARYRFFSYGDAMFIA